MPLGVLSIFYMAQVAIFKGLHGNSIHGVVGRFILTGIHQPLDFPLMYFLYDNVLLGLRR